MTEAEAIACIFLILALIVLAGQKYYDNMRKKRLDRRAKQIECKCIDLSGLPRAES